jgi:hypothetical protein
MIELKLLAIKKLREANIIEKNSVLEHEITDIMVRFTEENQKPNPRALKLSDIRFGAVLKAGNSRVKIDPDTFGFKVTLISKVTEEPAHISSVKYRGALRQVYNEFKEYQKSKHLLIYGGLSKEQVFYMITTMRKRSAT